MNFLNSHRNGGTVITPTAFVYDDAIAAYSLRTLPFTTVWTEPLIQVLGTNGTTDVYADVNGAIGDNSLTTGGLVKFCDWNINPDKPVVIMKWYGQNALNTIDTAKTLTPLTKAEAPYLWTVANGFNSVNTKVSANFISSSKIDTSSPISEMTNLVDGTISTISNNNLALSDGMFIDTGLESSSSLRLYNNRNGVLTVKNTSLSLELDTYNSSSSQRAILYSKNGVSQKLYYNGLLEDSGTSLAYFYNGKFQLGHGFSGNIQEVVLFDTYYSSVTDLTSEVNTYYQTY